jgi:sialic acid synthase SpsE/protoporphyrinogen oxidase
MNKKNDVIILGAGPVGLVTSWLLSKNNWNVKLYEMKDKIGGMCRTWKWKEFYLDTGPHIFHTDNKKLWNLWNNIFGKNLIEGTYYSKNTIGDKSDQYVDYPLSSQAIEKLPKKLKFKILKELKIVKKNKKKNAINFSEHIINQLGPTLQNLFFKDYPEKVWGLNTKEMTSEWAPKRIKFTKKSEPFFNKERTGVGKYGTGQLYEIIKKKIIFNGGKIFLNHKIVGFDKKNNEIKEIKFSKKKNIKLSKETIIISTLPITLTAKLLGFDSNLKFRGIRSIYIALNKKNCFKRNVNWLYFGNKNLIFNRVSEPKSMSSYLAPKNKTYLCAEICYFKNDKIDKMPLQQITKKVVDDLIKVKLIKKEEVIDTSDNKEDFVYPVQFVNYKYELSKTKHHVSKYNQIFSLGTGGDFNYADSQILFHKSIDLVNILTNKYAQTNNEKKEVVINNLNNNVKLGNKIVGDNYPTYIIAEAGLNHNGSIDIAKQLIDKAVECKCNAIKFQSFEKNSRVSSKVKNANYAEKADGLQENTNEMFNRLRLNQEFHKKIFYYAKKKKIEIFSTPFDEKSVDYLEKLKVNFYKIASVDAVNLPLIRKVGKTGKPLILSTGMTNISIIEDAIQEFKKTGNKNLILLHCLSSYPANEREMNLKAINTLKKIYNIPVGLSDHFPGIEIALMSIGIGANIIERHFTLDKNFEGPDHILSSEPTEMKKLVHFANGSNSIIGTGQKIIQPSEYEIINSQRKSIYAKKDIKKGEKFTKKNICIKGPAGGIMPKYIDMILGKKASESIKSDFPITWSKI